MSVPSQPPQPGDQTYLSQTFHAPCFGDEDFDLNAFPMATDDQSKSILSQQQHHQQPQQRAHVYIAAPVGHHVTLTGHQMGLNSPMAVAPNAPASTQIAMSQNASVTNCSPGMTGDVNMDTFVPKFPPQNFDVPDISLSNSVTSSGGDLFQALESSGLSATASMSQSPSVMYHSNVMSSASVPTTVLSTRMHRQQQPLLSTISQSQIASQLGFQTAMASSTSPGSSHSSSPVRESSEDSDDCLPLAQLVSMKRAASGAPMATDAISMMVIPVEGHRSSVSVPGVDMATSGGSPAKKQKPVKKKKKKDPNEPQKPVSAYALFFRDTQAAIKGQNPSASFGEVSKIVASMWDGLDPEHKEVYKKKTELAKKEYLKQLAAYRASQVSQSAAEEAVNPCEKSPSPPSLQPMNINQSSTPVSTAITTMTTINTVQARQHAQQHSLLQQVHQVQPLQMMRQFPSPQRQEELPPQMYQPVGPQSPQALDNMLTSLEDGLFTQSTGQEMPSHMNTLCVRDGCHNMAIENPSWDAEYCSNECVVTHCRDIFTAWVASRGGANTFPVK